MKNKFARKVSIWFFFTGVIAGLAYSALVLAAPRVYASGPVCEAEDCSLVDQLAEGTCATHGGVRFVACPVNNAPDNWAFECTDGFLDNGNCADF